jgi:hypothetical protein
MPFIVDGTNGGFFPSWTTATRPASPAVGQMGYNTTTGAFDAYTAAGWVSVASSATAPVNGPAFSAYANAVQTVSVNTFTKIAFQVEDFDTASAFDNATNYRFTPQVAGYYQVNSLLFLNQTAATTIQGILALYKNGGSIARLFDTNPNAGLVSNTNTSFGNSMLVYLNGSTDYIELYGYYFGGTLTFSSTSVSLTSRFSASMVRGA